jgi:RNA polymerase sigma factor (sigma-70 family)
MTTTPVDSSAVFDVDRAAELLGEIALGRDGALDDLVRLCAPLVRRQARRHAWQAGDVDDVVQDVWIRLVLNVDRIRDPRALPGWLNVVTRRSAALIGRRRSQLVPTDLADDRANADSTEDEAIGRQGRAEVTSTVRSALGRLRDRDQRLLVLLHRDDRPGYREISREVRRPIGSLGPTRQRLLARLRTDAGIAGLAELQPAS